MAPQNLEKKPMADLQQIADIVGIALIRSGQSTFQDSSKNFLACQVHPSSFKCMSLTFCFVYPSPTVLGCLDVSHHARPWQPDRRREPAEAGLPGSFRRAPCRPCCSVRPRTRLQRGSARKAGERGRLPRQMGER